MFDFLASLGSKLYEVDDPHHLKGWELNEIRNHDARGSCDGTDYTYGKWGGLICTKCGK